MRQNITEKYSLGVSKMKIQCVIGVVILAVLMGCRTTDAPSPQEDYTIGSPMLAGMYWAALQFQGSISQFPTNQHGELKIFKDKSARKLPRYPRNTDLRVQPETESDVYYWYTIRKQTPDSTWEVIKIWKTDSRGKTLVESLPLPSEDAQRAANQELNNKPYIKRFKKE